MKPLFKYFNQEFLPPFLKSKNLALGNSLIVLKESLLKFTGQKAGLYSVKSFLNGPVRLVITVDIIRICQGFSLNILVACLFTQ